VQGGAISALSPTDEELMHLVQTGDSEAFQMLFSRYKAPIWSYLFRRTGNREATADLYQEVFLRVWRAAHTYRVDQRVKPWIYRISTNVVHDQYRKSTRQVQTVELDDFSPGHRFEPLATRDLERAIASLPETLRDAFLLGAVEGLDHKEVAQALGIQPDNARARISRARIQLKKTLSEGAAS
jgi:RNA polymerase sigma-70 factor (ECF subfamily)